MSFEKRRQETVPEGVRRIRELGLRIEGSPVEPLVQQLYTELDGAGISLKPPCFVADEWGCPDGVPAIGVPFYLVDKELAAVEERETEHLETETDIRQILRHEAGHAFCYAHKLYIMPAFRDQFGPFTRPYLDDFSPMPFSRAYVRHLPGWYAQKHPDEDFAETFAVYVTPGLDWKKQYAGWPAQKKLQFLDDIVRELGRKEPEVVVQKEQLEDEGLDVTLPEHYQQLKAEARSVQLGELLDADLSALFGPKKEGAPSAAHFVRDRRKAFVNGVAYWTGARTAIVRGIVDHVQERTAELGLTVDLSQAPSLNASLASLITTLVLNHMMRGRFVEM